MKRVLKTLLGRVAPRWTAALVSARARAHSHRVVADWGCRALNRKLIERFGSRVREGPFAGVVLTPITHAEQLGPYLLGVYESELDGAWATVFRGDYTQIIDIGAKFGYYAVGLARRYPGAAVVAFDTDWWARRAIRQVVAANEPTNVEVRSFCGPSWITQNAHQSSLVLSDCEGYEDVLFQPRVVRHLRSVALVIETHDHVAPGVSNRLQRAFDETHAVRVYETSTNRRTPTTALDFLTERERRLAVQEARSPGRWLLCLPKTGPNRGLRLCSPTAGADTTSRLIIES